MTKSMLQAAAPAAVLLGACLIASPATADVGRAAMITTSCFTCHSIDVTGNMPNLVGYPRDLLISQMQMFSNGSRPATIMDRIAKGYSDEEFVMMADYFSSIQQ